MKRNWSSARAKVEEEGVCRVCRGGGYGNPVEAAHVLGRAYDPPTGDVRRVDVVPLCQRCHQAYDARKLDLLPYLSLMEQAAAVLHVGIARALGRIGGPGSSFVPIEKVVARGE